MKRTTKIVYACILLLSGFTFAAVMPIGYSCQILPGDVDEVLCTVAQETSDTKLNTSTYNVYDSWNSFKNGFVSAVESNAQLAMMGDVYIEFETDIDLGGYSEAGKKCANEDFSPLDLSSILINGQLHINGNGNTIKGFCYIAEDKNTSFFGTLKNAYVESFTFDSAYVMAKFKTSSAPGAAVVADRVEENTVISNVKVLNSKVYGWGAAAIATMIEDGKLSDIQVDNVLVSLSEEVIKDFSSKTLSSPSSYAAGVAIQLNNRVELSNITVSNLVIPDSVSEIMGNGGEIYTGCFYAGGIAALANLTGEIPLDGISISAKLSGSTVGGLIASVSANNDGTTKNLNVTGAKVSLKSGDYNGTNQNRYLGGFFGVVSWKHGDVVFSANEVEFALTNKKTGAGANGSDIGGLVGYFGGLNESDIPVNLYIEENQVKAEINAVEKQLYVGGFLGSVSLAGVPNSTLSIKKSTIKPIDPKTNPNVISAPNANLGMINAAYGVGGISNGAGIVEILGNHAEGDINIAATSVATSSNVGGMIGLANVKTLEMYNNTSVGNLLTSMTNGIEAKTSGHFYIGYEIGCVTETYPSAAKIKVNGNYHYGSKDVNARLAFGWLGESGNGAVSPELWKTQQVEFYQVYHNYRNAVLNGSVSLDAEGVLDIGGYGAIYVKNEEKWLYDGVIDSDAMKSRLFTYILNVVSAGAKDCSDPDAVCWENEVDALPKISTYRTAYQIKVDLDEIWDELSDADKSSLKGNLEETKSGSHSLTFYTEDNGAPNYDFIRRINKLSVIYGVFKENASNYTEVDLYNLYSTSNSSLKAKLVPYEKLYLDVNTANKELFYGVGSDISDSLVVPNSLRDVELPSVIYTADACVAGWSFDKDAPDYDYHMVHPGETIYKDVNAEKTLYAVWWGADECANGHYAKVALNSKNGTIAVDEYRGDVKAYSHHFAKDSTMLLPVGIHAGDVAMLVHAEPDLGYALDSLVVVTRDPYQTPVFEERFRLFDGDSLFEYHLRYATMTAYFSETKENNGEKGGDLALVRHEFAQSGNAVQMTIETNNFDVRRSATLQVDLTDTQGVALEDPWIVKSITKTPYNDVWTRYPLKPGRYIVKVMLYDGQNTVSFDTLFTVNAEIAAEPDEWKMLSLSDVDLETIVWDDDPLFYRWDEGSSYGEYWKYQKYRDGEFTPQQGYWYSSMEGRSLMLHGESPKSGKEVVWELDSGWNMMANPYGWAISLDELSEESLDMWKWNEKAGYGDATAIGPYEGIWVLSDRKKEVRFNASPEFDSQKWALLKQRALGKVLSRKNWNLQLTLSDMKGHWDSWNVLGVGKAEERLEPPEGMGDHVNLSVVSGEKALAKSVVAPKSETDGYSWQVALSASSDRVGYLKFEGLADLAGLGYRVYVTYEGETREVPAGDSLKVMLKAKGATATVQVTTSEVRTLASKLENLRFNRVSGALQVGFDVSSDLAGSLYKVQLVGLNGQVAATYSAKSTAGRNTLALTAPKLGLYLLRVTVGGHHAVRKVAISR
ncbi:hypothetical protein [Fibrobacter sp.]|uniref:hypothetical protein n=1 Tax=Fibrobacter sp. TaxID=35828 RepID=UPI0038639EE0